MENYFLDDGAYLMVRLLIAMAKLAKEGKELSALIESLQMPKEAAELRVNFNAGVDFKTLGQKLIKDFKAYGENLSYATPATDNFEGFRLRYDDTHGNGWALIRLSLHDPVLPINVESDVEDGAIKIVKDLYYFLKNYDFFDLAPFENYIQAWREKKTSAMKGKLPKFRVRR
jgi:phosphomannomutase